MNTKFRIKYGSFEFEVEGTENYVNFWSDKLEGTINEILKMSTKKQRLKKAENNLSEQSAEEIAEIEGNVSFGEHLNKFPRDLTQVDQILISGYYSQKQSENSNFQTKDASKFLKDQGIKIANPSACISKNREKKFVFNDGKDHYKVSKLGIDYISELAPQEE